MSAVTTAPPTTSAAPVALPESARHGAFDWSLLVLAAMLTGLGLLMMLSASSLKADADYGDAFHFVTRQIMGLGLGVTGAVAVLMMPWRTLRRASWLFYAVNIAMLAMVFLPGIGFGANGARRWVTFGFLNLQPSEFTKIAIILVLSDFLTRNEGRVNDLMGVLTVTALIPVPALLLVLAEPDFGSTVVLSALCALMVFLAGLRWIWFGLLGGLGVGGLGFVMLLEPYRVRRLTSFMDPFADKENAGYQVVQGWIALASGGSFGQGIGSGISQRGFLPEAHTDFISAVLGEEMGAVGWVGMVALYVGIILRGLRIANGAPDLFGQLAAMGVTALLGMQAIINLGVVVGWLPAKGLVLPFMSYGASAITVHVLCVGILLRIGLEGDGSAKRGES